MKKEVDMLVKDTECSIKEQTIFSTENNLINNPSHPWTVPSSGFVLLPSLFSLFDITTRMKICHQSQECFLPIDLSYTDTLTDPTFEKRQEKAKEGKCECHSPLQRWKLDIYIWDFLISKNV